jgi:hypothetical protein
MSQKAFVLHRKDFYLELYYSLQRETGSKFVCKKFRQMVGALDTRLPFKRWRRRVLELHSLLLIYHEACSAHH